MAPLVVYGSIYKIQHIRNDLGRRIVRDHVAVVIAESISGRRGRHVAVISSRHCFQPRPIIARQTFPGTHVTTPVRIPLILRNIASIMTDEPVPVLGPEMVLRPVFVPVSVAVAPSLVTIATISI